MKCVVLLGPPGAGKGTQGKRLCETLGWVHFSTGDLIRREIAEGTVFGKSVVAYQREGKLVPDTLLLTVVANFFKTLNADGIVSDGFPRNLAQAIALDETLVGLGASSSVIHLTTPLDVITQRALARRVCVGCGAIFNLRITPPQKEDVCDICGKELTLRADDTESVIAVRYGIYEQEIAGLLSYYGKRVVTVDGSVSPEAVFKNLELVCGVV